MLKRIGVGLMAIIIYGIYLELGERLEIPGVHSLSPPRKPSSAAP